MAAKLNFLAIITFIILGLYFFFAPPTSSDTWWHLSVGREVFQTKKIPTQDSFVYCCKNTNYPSTEWLAGLIFYLMTQAFGNLGMPILRTVLGLATMFIVYQTLKIFSEDKWVNSATCLIIGYVLGYRLFDRPESFSFVAMALINYLILKYLIEKKLANLIYLMPPIFFIWINIHAYFFLGIASLFFLLLISALKKDRNNLVKIASVVIICLLTFLTRFGAIYEFLAKYNGISTIHIGEFDTLWQRLMITNGFDIFHQTSLDIYIYFVTLLAFLPLLLLLFLKLKNNLDKIIVALFYLGYLLSPIKIIRMLSPAILTSLPFLIYLSRDHIKMYQKVTLYISISLFFVFIYVLGTSTINGDILGMRLFHSVIYQYNGSQGPGKPVAVTNHYWTQIFPKGAEKIINNYLDAKRIFTVNYWSNYFIWTVPKAKVFSDSMVAYKTMADWDAEDSLIYGTDGWEQNLQKYNIDTVVDNQPNVFIQNFTPVWKLDKWKLIFVNDTFAVYARQDIIKKPTVDLSKIHLDLNTPLKFKSDDEKEAVSELENLIAFDPKNAFARQQLVAYYLDHDIEKAQNLAIESRSLIPGNPHFSLYLAQVAAQNGNCAQAKNYADEAKDKSFDDFMIKIEIQKIYQKCPG